MTQSTTDLDLTKQNLNTLKTELDLLFFTFDGIENLDSLQAAFTTMEQALEDCMEFAHLSRCDTCQGLIHESKLFLTAKFESLCPDCISATTDITEYDYEDGFPGKYKNEE